MAVPLPPRRSSGTIERPLLPPARLALVLAAAATMLAFYATALVGIVLLFLALLVLAVVAAGAARFGAVRYITPLMEPPATVLGILVRHFWLPAPVEYRIALQPSDAPRLFALAGDVARRLGVQPPTSVVVEMHCGAWVNLKGFRRAAGKSTLGIGFDLLAGLTTTEIEAVLAHELAHARLVQRGFSRWLNKGLARLVNVSRRLGAYHAERESSNQPSELAEFANKLFDTLTIRAARLVATYSRQDEFDADRGAAELCGSAALRSTLTKLPALDDAAGRLPWQERVARIQPGENFSQWLVAELAGMVRLDEPGRHAADPYSTHPTLHDRLAALPADRRPLGQGATGLDLLARPDDVAARLATEIQRVLTEQERKDSKLLARETRKFCKRTGSQSAQLVGVIGIVFGVLIGLMFVVPLGPGALEAGVTAAVSTGLGVALMYAGRYRDRRKVPVPEFGTLTVPSPYATRDELAVAEEKLAEQFRAEIGNQRGVGRKVGLLVAASYGALGERDYLRAHVAARLARELKPKSVEAALGYAIAAASIGNLQQAQVALATVRQEAGLTTPSTLWGYSWALVMLRDWNVEGLLERLHQREPKVATHAALLALAQLSRGKFYSAVRNARTACGLAPGNAACRQLLVDALLAIGNVQDAGREAGAVEDAARTSVPGALQMVRLRLMLRDAAGALEWAGTLRGVDAGGQSLLALGAVFEGARLNETARGFYSEALATPYQPQANIGLAGLAQAGGDRAGARQHLIAALKLEGASFRDGETPSQLFHAIIQGLNVLEARRVRCRAWIATIPEGSSSPLAGASLMVCATDLAAAKAHVDEITAAMQGAETPFDPATVSWTEASREQQPLRPVAPGVQFAMSAGG